MATMATKPPVKAAAPPSQAQPAAAPTPEARPPAQPAPAQPPRQGPPPAPEVPRRPPRQPRPAGSPPPSPPPEPPKYRVLPSDPEAARKALESVRDESALIMGMLGVLAERLPPKLPLTDQEKMIIQGPLDRVLYKYGENIPCEWQLIIAVGFVAVGRFAAHELAKKAQGAPGAGGALVQVK
jgi:hypothetical protein